MNIYISTDSNEVKQIFEKREIGLNEFLDDYNFSSDRIRLNGEDSIMINLPMIDGKNIKKNNKLCFNPMSVVKLSQGNSGCLISKLLKEGLFVSLVSNKGKIENYFPTKYDGYQGRKFN